MRKAIVGLFAAAMLLGGPTSAWAADVADDQGFCKKQGASSCAGGSECSTAGKQELPKGQAKKC
jgi:hypothetical protein